MTVATELLEQGERIASVARQVGYDNEFAFAKAFKRVCGRPPGEIRRSARDRAAARTETSATPS
jgi:AraC-like DNA-binding protein